MKRRKIKRIVKIGDIQIGGEFPIRVQSMTNTPTKDWERTVSQIKRLEDAGCEIVRVSVPDEESARAIGKIKSKISIPLVADIHFDYKLALISMEEGVDKLRINPGNIGARQRVEVVVEKAKKYSIPIRVGVNSGSVPRDLLEKYGFPTPGALVESALRHVKILEELEFYDIVISLKSSDVITTVDAYEKISEVVNYPLHIGITEAGTFLRGTVFSSVGLGILLFNGIGDTLRVSLTDDPVREVEVGFAILKSLKLRSAGVDVISCPTCARCHVDVIELAKKVEKEFKGVGKNITIAVMGCEVNGPGEAREADYGIAGGKSGVLVFKKGKIVKKVRYEECFEFLKKIIEGKEYEGSDSKG